MKYEGGTGTPNDAKLQQHVYDFFDTDSARRYWVQRNGTVRVFRPISPFFIPHEFCSSALSAKPAANLRYFSATTILFLTQYRTLFILALTLVQIAGPTMA